MATSSGFSRYQRSGNYLQYLYGERGSRLVASSLLLVPAVAMLVAAVWVGFETAKNSVGVFFAAVLAVLSVVLAVVSTSEAFPLMPAASLLNKKRYRIAAGRAYLALAVVMLGFFFVTLHTVWEAEPAAKIDPWMPTLLALVGVVGAIVQPALLVSIHIIPKDLHRQVVEFELNAEWAHRTRKLKAYFKRVMLWVATKLPREQTLSDEDRDALQRLGIRIVEEIATLEKLFIDEMTRDDVAFRTNLEK